MFITKITEIVNMSMCIDDMEADGLDRLQESEDSESDVETESRMSTRAELVDMGDEDSSRR